MKTFSAKAQEQTNRQWYVIDAKDQILGDVAVAAANIIRGKTKPIFTPHVDTGDFVVVLNAAEVRLSGKKEQQKIYTSKRGFIGNQKVENVERVLKLIVPPRESAPLSGVWPLTSSKPSNIAPVTPCSSNARLPAPVVVIVMPSTVTLFNPGGMPRMLNW